MVRRLLRCLGSHAGGFAPVRLWSLMNDDLPLPSALEERFARLEARLEELGARLDALPATSARTGAPPAPSPAALRERGERWAFRGEQWTGRLGLGLLFLGLIFLFQYSIEQGWITPWVRVGFGAALGGTFLALGLRMERRRASYGALLLAGAIASFYATGWAAFQLYGLVSRPPALVWMAGVTVLALLLARRQAQPALASLGAMGGFATPFLLGAGQDAVLELVVYATLVVLWTAALYFARGWRSVLWTYTVGGLAVLAVAGQHADGGGGGERWIVQGALVLTWALGVALPFGREARDPASADPRPKARLPFALELRVLGAGGSAAMLWITNRLWGLSDRETGILFLVAALLYAVFAWVGTRRPNFVARSAAPVAAALCATSTFLLLEGGPILWWVVSSEALAFVYGGGRERFRGLEWVGHGLFALLGLALLDRALFGPSSAFDALAWSHLAGVGLAAIASVWVRPAPVAWLYRVGAHALVLLWLAEEFDALAGGTAWVTLAWGIYGGLLLLVALEWGRRRGAAVYPLQLMAAAALGLTVLKLLWVDLSAVSALVRIPLFLGMGMLLLLLSARFQRSTEPMSSS